MQNEIESESDAEAEEDVDSGNQTMAESHEKYRVTVSWIKRGIHKGMLVTSKPPNRGAAFIEHHSLFIIGQTSQRPQSRQIHDVFCIRDG